MSGFDFADPAAFADLLRTTPDAIVVTDNRGLILEFNAGAEAIFGWTRAEVLGQPVGKLIVPERLRAAHEDGMARIRTGDAPRFIGRRVERPALRRNGREFPCEVSLSTFSIGGTEVFAAIMRDVSKLHAAFEEQRRATAFLRSIFDDQTEVIFRFDSDLRVTFANDAALRLYGRPLDRFLGQSFFADVDPEVAPRLRAELEALTPENPTIRAVDPKRFPDGQVKWIDWTNRALFDAQGRRSAYLSVGRDVTERRLSEMALAEVEARFETFMRNAPVGMYLKDNAGRYVLANPEMEQVFGRPVEEVIGMTAAEVFGPPVSGVIDAADEAVRRTGVPSAIEEHLPGADRYAWSLVVRFPIPTTDGSDVMIGGFDIDISKVKHAEQEVARARDALFQAEKLNALGAFAAGVAHELNNPLMILSGQAAMLAEEAAGSPLAERAETIERLAQRCGRIAQSFLSIARRKPAVAVPMDLHAPIGAVLDITDFILQKSAVAVRKKFAPDLPLVVADPDQMHQVMLNLVFNAQQAMAASRGPRVLTIETAPGEDGRCVHLDVSDTGRGIPAEERERIFEPFFTTRGGAGGTGLGLSFCRSAITELGGQIALVDSPVGARFRITLPCVPVA